MVGAEDFGAIATLMVGWLGSWSGSWSGSRSDNDVGWHKDEWHLIVDCRMESGSCKILWVEVGGLYGLVLRGKSTSEGMECVLIYVWTAANQDSVV